MEEHALPEVEDAAAEAQVGISQHLGWKSAYFQTEERGSGTMS